MMKKTLAAFALIALLPVIAEAQSSRAQLLYDSAYIAWQEGKYPDALAKLKRVLSGSDAAQFTQPAALLTGEYFRTTEVTRADQHVINVAAGNAPKWSPDGRHFAFET